METILLMVAIFVISSLLNGNKKHKEKKSMPPFNNKSQPPIEDLPRKMEPRKSASKSLEDFASEIFEKLNENSTTQTSENTKEKPEDVKSHTTVKEVEKNSINPNSRRSLDINRSVRSTKEVTSRQTTDEQQEIGSIVPTSRKAFMQAIVTSEILGPPKAKQR